MPFFRNFTYWIDKRKWKYVFLLASLELSSLNLLNRIVVVQVCDATEA